LFLSARDYYEVLGVWGILLGAWGPEKLSIRHAPGFHDTGVHDVHEYKILLHETGLTG
jgi:hypothetical protein